MDRCVYHPVPWHTQLVAKRDQNWVTAHFKVHSQTEVGRTATCGTATYATPKMTHDFLHESKTISFEGCMAQIFWLHVFAGGEMVLLVAMAYDSFYTYIEPHYLHTEKQRSEISNA
ncbi:olfactory receptor 4K5-like isoform X2 [Ailuropoda melanoleuca]|uniref:olfactory receptor 4K5-like isoform X2 n=1 Tax=Ailuropoda melanoleuca TaxID=9646 RepID=UPI001494B3DA|nr:olfactory receptor 4K5-like isoform X2 [Ailuropoda melanoleuca]